NSNPATIMTDPAMADRTYVEPITLEVLAKIIEPERPDAAATAIRALTEGEFEVHSLQEVHAGTAAATTGLAR
ncbi:MAG: hypothetical protein KAX19_13575, partial [Candidatus Brocadiae bacterium]|nr:hypothetical protein [Candidatus Brocadiia bacterium]